MAAIVPDVTIQLDKERHLRFDQGSVYTIELELERVLGKEYTTLEAMQKLALAVQQIRPERISMNVLSVFVWQGCLRDDPTLTLQAVRDLLPNGTDVLAIFALAGAVVQAWMASVPELVQASLDTTAPEEGVPDEHPFVSIGAPAGPLGASSSASVMTNSGG